jgi:thymidylate kinase
MSKECLIIKKSLIYVVDRWCSSTFAYTIGDQTEGDENSIHNLHTALLKWPIDLLKPTLQLVLLVDEDIRRDRVIKRADVSGISIETAICQWDNKIQKDSKLGRRILEILKLIDVNKVYLLGASIFNKLQ